MALTAAQIVNLSVQAAKCPGVLGQAGQLGQRAVVQAELLRGGDRHVSAPSV